MAIIGKGTTIGYSAYPTPATYTDLAEVYNVTSPSVDIADVKVTHYGNTTGYHDYIAGFSEGGEVSVDCNYSKTTADFFNDNKRVNKTWKITLPDTSTFVFGGYVKAFSVEMPLEDRVTVKATIKVISDVTFTPAV